MGQLYNFAAGISLEVLPSKYVDNILLNVPQNAINESAISQAKKLIRLARAKKTILDSGGFQIYVAEDEGKKISFDNSKPLENSDHKINISPEHVVAAAIQIRPDILMSLDFPIRKLDDPEDQEFEFNRKIGFNARWAIETSELRDKFCPEVKLFVPIQAYNLNQLHLFMRLIQGVNFDGLSMPLRNLTTNEIASFLVTYYEMGISEVHLLGSTSFSTISLVAYMAKHYFDFISIDATSWRKSAEYSIYLNPHDLRGEGIGSDAIIDDNIQITCPCPWCLRKTFTDIKNLPYTEKTSFLRCHNFFVINTFANEAYLHADNLTTFKRFLIQKSRKPEEIESLCDILAEITLLMDSDIKGLKRLLTS